MKRLNTRLRRSEDECGDEYQVLTSTLALKPADLPAGFVGTSRKARAVRRRFMRSLSRELVSRGLVQQPRYCGCRVCQADGDCCGHWIAGWPLVERMGSRLIRVTQRFERNL